MHAQGVGVDGNAPSARRLEGILCDGFGLLGSLLGVQYRPGLIPTEQEAPAGIAAVSKRLVSQREAVFDRELQCFAIPRRSQYDEL